MGVQQAYPTVNAGCGCGSLRAFPAPQTPGQQGPGQTSGQMFGPGFGPGPFPPFPGPGPFPPFPGPGPFPPSPGPGPFPPSPGPGPFPPFPGPGQRFVTVFINGGRQFPWLTRSYSIPHRFGLTVRQALASTGAVQFGLGGQIVSVGGVYTGPGSNIRTTVRLNGRELQPGFLNAPVTPGSFISLELSRFV